jgi:hypothetical protein
MNMVHDVHAVSHLRAEGAYTIAVATKINLGKCFARCDRVRSKVIVADAIVQHLLGRHYERSRLLSETTAVLASIQAAAL